MIAELDTSGLDRKQLECSLERITTLRRSSDSTTSSDIAGHDAAREVAERAIVIDGLPPDGPFAFVECRPPGNMVCFNVRWGIASALLGRGWPVTTIAETDPIGPACAATLAAAGEMPVVVVVRGACMHTWQSAVVDALVRARPNSVVVVEMGWPGGRPAGCASYIVTHGAAQASADALLASLGVPQQQQVREP